MKKKYINYLIRQLREDRAMTRRFWRSCPATKNNKSIIKQYQFQLDIIRALQALKGE